MDGSLEAGGFGAFWFIREDGKTILAVNLHRNIHLLAAALTGEFLGERRPMWSSLQVLTQR